MTRVADSLSVRPPPDERPRRRGGKAAAVALVALVAVPLGFVGGALWAQTTTELTKSPLNVETTKSYALSPAMSMPELTMPELDAVAPERAEEAEPADDEEGAEDIEQNERKPEARATRTPSETDVTNWATRQLNRYQAAKVRDRANAISLDPKVERAVEKAETNRATRELIREKLERLDEPEPDS